MPVPHICVHVLHQVGGAALGAGVLLAVTGGLAAPAIAAGLGAAVVVAGGGAAAGAAVAGAAGWFRRLGGASWAHDRGPLHGPQSPHYILGDKFKNTSYACMHGTSYACQVYFRGTL